jgi:uncharacterized membrane protein YbaN (DUF454 family)
MNSKDKSEEDHSFDETKLAQSRFSRGALIVAGSISLGLGIIGIILPLLPTTPFLLLAAWCYARSSKKFYIWLINNKRFGRIIKNYYEGKGIPLHVKIYAISLLWVTILLSSYLFIEMLLIRIILIIIATLVTIHILRFPTLKKTEKTKKE